MLFMKTLCPSHPLPATGALLLALGFGLASQAADYASRVLSHGPVAYWRFNEAVASPSPNIVANSGSLGSVGNGYIVMDVGKGEPGKVGNAIRLNNTSQSTAICGSKVDVPFNPALNPAAPFSVEFWAKPNGLGTDADGLSPISCFNPNWYGGGNRTGWIFYLNNAGRWEFRLGLTSGYDVALKGASGNATVGVWQHIVATFDGVTARLYINGNPVGSAVSGGKWKPNTQMALRIGGTPLGDGEYAEASARPYIADGGIAGNRGFDGWMDEVAIYASALPAAKIADHFAAATNPVTYGATVLADNPVGYWNMDEPAVTAPDPSTYPTAANSGGAGSDADGTNTWGVVTAASGPAYAGFGADNRACVFNGVAGHFAVGDASALHFNGPVTLMAWVKPTVKDFFRDIVAHGTDANNQETFLRISQGDSGDGYGDGNYYEVGSALSSGGMYYESAVIPMPEGDIGNWVFLAGTYDGSQWNLYRNGTLVASRPTEAYVGAVDVAMPWSVGSRSNPSAAEGLYFGGAIDEPAIFNKALSATQIKTLYNEAQVPPVITRGLQAPSGLVYAGASVSFSVWAEGSPTLSYQWTSNSVPLGLTGTNITVSNLSGGNTTIAVVVQNSYGSATSSVLLNVVTAAPTVIEPPEAATRYSGSPFAFSVTAGGNTPLAYQWKRNAVAIPGATSASYSGIATAATAGNYVCTISNAVGSTDTAPVALSVLPIPAGYPGLVLSNAPIAFWRLGETSGTVAGDYVGGHDGEYKNVLLAQPGYSSSEPDKAAVFGGTDSYVGRISGTEINFSGRTSFSIELWAKGPAGQSDESTLIAKGIGSSGTTATEQFAIDISGGKYRFFTRAGGNEVVAAVAAVGPKSVWQHVVGVYDDSEGINQMHIYVNGELQGSGATSSAGLRVSSDPVSIGSKRLGNDPAYDGSFEGTIDEVAIYPAALTADDVAAHYRAAYGELMAPSISLQPAAVTNYVGLPATFTVGAEGTMPLSYQWLKGGKAIANANQMTYTIDVLTTASAGDYSVRVTNERGTVTSQAARLTVLQAPTAPVALPGLRLHLPFDNNLIDSTGRGNNGTNIQITATSTNIGGAATFVEDGKLGAALHYATDASDAANVVSDYVTLGKRADLQFGSDIDFTVAFWIRAPNYAGNDLPFFTDATGSTFGTGFVFAPTYAEQTSPDPLWPGGWALSLYGDAGGIGVYGDIGSINDGDWHHLVHVFDRAQNVVTYLDGVVAHYSKQAGTTAAAAGNVNVDTPATIGQDPTGKYAETGSADIDDLGVWHRALSPLEAASVYMAGKNGFSFVKTIEPPTMTVQALPNGNLRLEWDGGGTLQQADQVTGTYSNVVGATSPYTVTPSAARKFYRVKL